MRPVDERWCVVADDDDAVRRWYCDRAVMAMRMGAMGARCDVMMAIDGCAGRWCAAAAEVTMMASEASQTCSSSSSMWW